MPAPKQPRPKQPRPRLRHHTQKFQVGQPVYHRETQRFGEVVGLTNPNEPNIFNVFFEDGTIESIQYIDLDRGYMRVVEHETLQPGATVWFNNNPYIVTENDSFFETMTIQRADDPSRVLTRTWDQWNTFNLQEMIEHTPVYGGQDD